jgi:hypothetical protein
MPDPITLPDQPFGTMGGPAPRAPAAPAPQQQAQAPPQIPGLPPGAVLIPERGDAPSGAGALPPGAQLMPDMDWGDAAVSGAKNLVPSVAHNVTAAARDLGTAVMHPIDTATNLSKLGVSISPVGPMLPLLAHAIKPYLSEEHGKMLDDQVHSINAPLKALIDNYKEAYGGAENFKKTLAEDPGRILMDIATIATGGEAALAKLPGMAGKVGKVAGVLKNVDPITGTMAGIGAADALSGGKLARLGETLSPSNVLGGAANATTGVGSGVMQEAFRSGKLGGEIANDFRDAMRGNIPVDTVLDRARQGVQTMKDAMFQKYDQFAKVWKADTTPLDFSHIDRAELSVLNDTMSAPGSKLKFKYPQRDIDRINNLQEIVSEWRNDPASHTMEGLDDLKQRLRSEVNWQSDSSAVKRAATKLSGAAKDAIMQSPIAASGPYKVAMRDYMNASDHINEIEQSLGIGEKAATHTAVGKLQSVMRNNANTLYGSRKAAAEALETSGNVSLMPMLAGQAASSWTGRGIGRGVFAGGLPALAAGLTHPAMWGPALAAGAGYTATMPRVMGEVFHGAGRMAPTVEKGFRGAFGVPGRYAAQNFERATPEQPYARGGRAFARVRQ